MASPGNLNSGILLRALRKPLRSSPRNAFRKTWKPDAESPGNSSWKLLKPETTKIYSQRQEIHVSSPARSPGTFLSRNGNSTLARPASYPTSTPCPHSPRPKIDIHLKPRHKLNSKIQTSVGQRCATPRVP